MVVVNYKKWYHVGYLERCELSLFYYFCGVIKKWMEKKIANKILQSARAAKAVHEKTTLLLNAICKVFEKSTDIISSGSSFEQKHINRKTPNMYYKQR